MSLIKKIRIKNFKNLEDVEIEVQPLTFLFGPNGSGKSSFIKVMMFLSKNLFPLNMGKTIYKISDEVDLVSFQEIVTNNELNRIVSFEFDLEGKYEFPTIDIFNERTYGLEGENIVVVNDFKDKSFFNEIEDIIENNRIPEDSLYDIFSFNSIFSIEYCYNREGINFSFLKMRDNDNLSSINYKNSNEGSIKYFRKEHTTIEFNFFGDDNLSELFTKKLNLNFIPFLFRGHNLFLLPNNVPSLNEILSDKFNFWGQDNIYSLWDSFDEEKKKKIFYEVLKFLYLSHIIIQNLLQSFLKNKHLPIVREVPKSKYILERDEFEAKEYHGLLNLVSIEHNYIIEKTSPDKLDKDDFLNILVESYSGNLKGKEFFNIVVTTIQKSSNLPDNVLKDNIFILVNCYLYWLGFKFMYFVKKENELGKIFIYDKKKAQINFSNSSSGLIQVLPIIICLCHFKKSNLREHDTPIFKYKDNRFLFYREEYREEYRTLLIEQPELHLHPKLQSKLAELFSDTIKDSNEASSLIIETHSEHLIRKIQVLIAKGELDREKVGVWYFDNRKGKTEVTEMKIDEKGLFEKDWPDGFFDDSKHLALEMLEAMRKRNN